MNISKILLVLQGCSVFFITFKLDILRDNKVTNNLFQLKQCILLVKKLRAFSKNITVNFYCFFLLVASIVRRFSGPGINQQTQ